MRSRVETTAEPSSSGRRGSASACGKTIARSLLGHSGRAGLPCAARFGRDRSGLPIEVGVVDGGSLAGNDSSIASSSCFSSAARCSRDGFFAWSFIAVAPRRLNEWRRLSRRRIVAGGPHPYKAEGGRMRGGLVRPPRSAAGRQGPIPRLDQCSLLRAHKRFQGFRRLFVQLATRKCYLA